MSFLDSSPIVFPFQVHRVASPSTRFGNPVEIEVEMLTVIDARECRTYHRVTSHVMVDGGLDSLVPYTYVAWYRWSNRDLIGPLRGSMAPLAETAGLLRGMLRVGCRMAKRTSHGEGAS